MAETACLAEINPERQTHIIGNHRTVLNCPFQVNFLFKIVRAEWGTCRINLVELLVRAESNSPRETAVNVFRRTRQLLAISAKN